MTEHFVEEVRHEPGELSFEASIGPHRVGVRLRTDPERPTSDEAVLPATLMPAMRLGGTLRLPTPLSPRLLRNQRQFQGIQRAWSLAWEYGITPLEEVEVVAEARAPGGGETGRVAAFFSGGVDAWSTLLDNDDVTDLIFVRGTDLELDAAKHAALLGEVEAMARDVATELGLELHVVETNLRDLSNLLLPYESFLGSGLATVALHLGPRFDRVLVAGAYDFEVEEPHGVARLVSGLWSTERLEIVEDGGLHRRVEKIERISSHPLVQRTLRVCFMNPDGAYNCGRCPKCLQTMLTLEAAGRLAEFETFPELDLEAVATMPTPSQPALVREEDLLDFIRAQGRSDLEPAIEASLERGRIQRGVTSDYRRRALPGPPPLSPNGTPAGTPSSPPPTAAALHAETRERLRTVLESRSWRLTAPLRAIGTKARRLRARIRR
jgi:hypothetical protein